MKRISFQRALLLFQLFSTKRITGNDLHAAESKATHLDDKMADFKLLVSMCKDSMAGRYKMDKWNMSVVVGTILYVVSPVDAVPDLIPVLGWLDDVTIVGYAITKLSDEMRRYLTETNKKTVQTAL